MGNVNKRESRKEHGDLFKRVIAQYRDRVEEKTARKARKQGKSTQQQQQYPQVDPYQKITAFCRKRPIFKHELKKNEYDVVTVLPSHREICVHDCRMKADLKPENAFVAHNLFGGFDTVFDENATNDDVYAITSKSLVEHVCLGGRGTCFMYGQTGSGKTYTMTSIQKRVCPDLFKLLDEMNESRIQVSVSIFEMAGDTCYDLLNRREKVHLRQDGQGKIHVRGARHYDCSDPQTLYHAIHKAMSLRHTEGTDVNSTSSRSHCFTRIFLKHPDKQHPETGEPVVYGHLTLVDLAGSERNEDSMHHNAERRKECAQINTSLMALKNCVRMLSENERAARNGQPANNRIPYRDHKLTMLLKSTFTGKDSKTVVIATCSPIPTDTEHTINTLKHVSMMNVYDLESQKKYPKETVDHVKDLDDEEADLKKKRLPLFAPSKWNHQQTILWLSTVHGGKFKKFVDNFGSAIDGKQLMRFTKMRYTQCCDGHEKAGQILRDCFLNEIEKYNIARKERQKENMKK
uniref:Kinesin-like protein n=1 Tax=Percolomonas cosmopolitus TaxID=63605 RepID=A0A7S1KMH6_9EUKA|mmetsp:Transcript_1680/g.5887  ORF Transcript_1680/g.5887 Transcript_1680/m.5887 type:complete len:517 (+) Transcript_1680:353-1903(+)|eukprot:CAMPEP_0117443276 /NCGR_PEP_ID=MMETSP0759-20121206/4608_1 /TAXON_ID=63605 /ORGANISM="Percolomonas cosmopolitus, Strain WS" /LENGTH=516 /DNA_ID=CAMNT_0005235239 /DNA_START=287 /DNA_END=1837 /DNA_ORIENTATION=+